MTASLAVTKLNRMIQSFKASEYLKIIYTVTKFTPSQAINLYCQTIGQMLFELGTFKIIHVCKIQTVLYNFFFA